MNSYYQEITNEVVRLLSGTTSSKTLNEWLIEITHMQIKLLNNDRNALKSEKYLFLDEIKKLINVRKESVSAIENIYVPKFGNSSQADETLLLCDEQFDKLFKLLGQKYLLFDFKDQKQADEGRMLVGKGITLIDSIIKCSPDEIISIANEIKDQLLVFYKLFKVKD